MIVDRTLFDSRPLFLFSSPCSAFTSFSASLHSRDRIKHADSLVRYSSCGVGRMGHREEHDFELSGIRDAFVHHVGFRRMHDMRLRFFKLASRITFAYDISHGCGWNMVRKCDKLLMSFSLLRVFSVFGEY